MTDKAQIAGTPSILVRGIGLDSRKEAVFRMAFRMNRRANYSFLEADDRQVPDAAIADLDSPDGLAEAKKFRQEHPEIPLLATTVVPNNFPQFVTLAKPIRMETLFPALEQLLRPSPTTRELPPREPPEPVEQARSSTAAASPAKIPTSVQQPPVREKPSFDPNQINYFDPEQGLLALVQRAIRDQIPVGIVDRRNGRLLWQILPEQERVDASVSMEEAQAIFREGEENLILRDGASFTDNKSVHSMTLTEYLWQIHAIAADGRLSRKIPLNRPVKLRRWPNLTRLYPLPEALRLAAFLARSPASPALTIRMLQVHSQALFNFLAAADALQLLEYSSAAGMASEPAISSDTLAEAQRPSPAKRGLLGRLLAKIAGL
ncbi:response regulator [Acidithiobacillus sp. AMEEHan]|uniref:response regulator n=1 Tax=Acidithiobacillus sp. AMEEHan TaxID=2994951 RepID=UPI0027E3B6C2|nr:response regulator [Acidithiobacillus sp. AMEEHan]